MGYNVDYISNAIVLSSHQFEVEVTHWMTHLEELSMILRRYIINDWSKYVILPFLP